MGNQLFIDDNCTRIGMGNKVLHKKSNRLVNGSALAPQPSELEVGEIAVNYAASGETMFIKNSSGSVVSFSSDSIINERIDEKGVPTVSALDNNKVLQVKNGAWAVVTPLIVYSGNDVPSSSFGNDGDIFLLTGTMQQAPDVVYETDGTTGLLGHNTNGYDNQWQLEDLDLTPYKYIKCYFKATTLTDASTYTPAVIVIVPLDAAAKGTTIYSGGVMVPLPFNRNRQYLVSCAVDSTKTKFQVIHQNTLWDITTSDANNNGRYCYKIEGWY